MNIHEYQAKRLFADYGIPVARHVVIEALDQLDAALDAFPGERWVIKAQVHAGGRGKAGGVRLVKGRKAAHEAAQGLLGTRLVTAQTDDHGQPINSLLVEAPCTIARELYLGAVVDRSRRRIVFMASTEGGVDIEQVASVTPDKILTAAVDPLAGLQPYQCRDLGFALQLAGEQFKQLEKILSGMARLFVDKDLSLIEVNPLVVTAEGHLLCLDAKINADDNALYRHPDLEGLRDSSQDDLREVTARKWELNYIALDGEIGCMVNGAGLAMATMDLIKLHGGSPANFLDVGGTATQQRVAEAFKIILSDHQVRGILVNIFGGIVRCDLIAEGIIGAVNEVDVHVPVVVRLEGNNAKRGLELLEQSGLQITTATGLDEAARKIVAAVGGKS